jgi:two-component system chemotaxis response regulator CheB
MGLHAASEPAAPLRAVVCDDSAFMRRFLADALSACGVEVVAQAPDGRYALEACAKHRPDVMTLDLQMPGMSGMDVLRTLPRGGPGVIVVSSYTAEGSALAVEALSIGAAEVIPKPGADTSLTRFAADLQNGVKAAVASRRAQPAARLAAPATPAAPVAPVRRLRRLAKPLVVIASSTGGPRALTEVVPKLPNPCGAGVLIVQHMPAGFTESLARRLDTQSRLSVHEAHDRDRIEPGTALIAPGGYHLRLRGSTVHLSQEDAVGGLRPRADITIADVARDWPGRCVLMVLTGMGADGMVGARALKATGGIVLSEAEATCVVYGMPRAVEEAGLSDIVEPLGELAAALGTVM